MKLEQTTGNIISIKQSQQHLILICITFNFVNITLAEEIPSLHIISIKLTEHFYDSNEFTDHNFRATALSFTASLIFFTLLFYFLMILDPSFYHRNGIVSLDYILSQLSPTDIITTYFSKIYFSIVLPCVS
jgi:hypothetical protein